MPKKGPKKNLNTACWKPTKQELEKATWVEHQKMTANLLAGQYPEYVTMKGPKTKVTSKALDTFNAAMDEALQQQLASQIAKDIDAELVKNLAGKKVGKYQELSKEIEKLSELVMGSMKVPKEFLITAEQKPGEFKKWLGEMKEWEKQYINVDYAKGDDKTLMAILNEKPGPVPGTSSYKLSFEKASVNAASFNDLFFEKMDEDAKNPDVLHMPTYSELEKLYGGTAAESVVKSDKFTKDDFHSLRQRVQTWWAPKGMTQLAVKRFLVRHIPLCCPQVRDEDVVSPDALDEYLQAVYHHHFGTQLDPDALEVFEVTLSGLTEQEAKEVLSKYAKSKSGKSVFQSTKQLKEIGTNSKAIIAWNFESSSMAVNGQPLLYKTQLNEDGTMSCNCMGWTRGSAKSVEGRFCKHTRAIENQFEVATLYKKWKKGEPLGDEFIPAGSEEPKKAGETKGAVTFTAKRIVEI